MVFMGKYSSIHVLLSSLTTVAYSSRSITESFNIAGSKLSRSRFSASLVSSVESSLVSSSVAAYTQEEGAQLDDLVSQSESKGWSNRHR